MYGQDRKNLSKSIDIDGNNNDNFGRFTKARDAEMAYDEAVVTNQLPHITQKSSNERGTLTGCEWTTCTKAKYINKFRNSFIFLTLDLQCSIVMPHTLISTQVTNIHARTNLSNILSTLFVGIPKSFNFEVLNM